MIRARGLEPGKDIDIVYTGLRPGEKISEALTGEHERLEPTSHTKVLSAVSSFSFEGAALRSAIRDLDHDRQQRSGNIPARMHSLARFDIAAQA